MLSQKDAMNISLKVNEKPLKSKFFRMMLFIEKTKVGLKISIAAHRGERSIYMDKNLISKELINYLEEKGYKVYGDEYDFIYTFCGWIQPIYIEW